MRSKGLTAPLLTGNAFTSATSLGHGGRQDYGTPVAFTDIVSRYWGPICFDLAAHERNHKAPRWFGPGGEAADSLAPEQDWAAIWAECTGDEGSPLLWLNPPFSVMTPWARKCHESAAEGARIALLAPANVGAAWWWDYVLPSAHVLILQPRLAFDGAPVRGKEKDLAALCLQNGLPVTVEGGRYINPPWSGFIVGQPNKGSLSIDTLFFDGVLGFPHGRIPKGFTALPFPGPLMLALYGCGQEGRLSRWAWKEDAVKAKEIAV